MYDMRLEVIGWRISPNPRLHRPSSHCMREGEGVEGTVGTGSYTPPYTLRIDWVPAASALATLFSPHLCRVG